jgi:hypothetical protein
MGSGLRPSGSGLAWRALVAEDLSALDLRPILAEFRSRPQIRQALVQIADSHAWRADVARRNRAQAEELLKLLDAGRGAP